ncbi:helix-turn-helix domain-containing protein [Cellulomonas sp. ACRRI]|uniref:PucR family transcriptional regulator n=1 Tax=Cellulomonas sp. ACRRI TaxID=2918188 RepID=UPI001EF30EC5|nr:PucR family transcriptional regulator [Cellulomonas sp. ACRRI]MCG7288165.1 helix-turn-helix domain-containing protein [Cellulomonas sp. ACRRI]
MATVSELVARGAHHGLRVLGAGDPAAGEAAETAEVREVATVGDLASVGSPGAGTLVVLMASALRAAEPYEVDVAVRRSAQRSHAGLVLVGAERVPVTAARIASRAGLPLLAVPATADVNELIVWLNRTVRGGTSDTVARAEAVLDVLARGAAGDDEAEDGGVAALLAAVSDALGRPVELHGGAGGLGGVGGARGAGGAVAGSAGGAGDGPADPGAVLVGERVVGTVRCAVPDRAADLVIPSVAAAVGRLVRRTLEHRFAPSQTRAELLAQIVVAEPTHLVGLTEQARSIGLPVDSTHVAFWVDLRPRHDGEGDPPIAERRRLLSSAEMLCLEIMHPSDTWWHVVRVGGSLLLLASDDDGGDGRVLVRAARADVDVAVARLVADEGAVVHVGMGTDQRGLGGIRQSSVEARSAAELALRTGRPGVITVMDTTGLRRVLADLHASPLSRRVMDELLAPVDALGATRAATAVRTLTAYLDHQCSPKHAGAALHLHPNAVTYRIQRITETLGVDLSDPDVRLGLHLACRMRGLLDAAPAS